MVSEDFLTFTWIRDDILMYNNNRLFKVISRILWTRAMLRSSCQRNTITKISAVKNQVWSTGIFREDTKLKSGEMGKDVQTEIQFTQIKNIHSAKIFVFPNSQCNGYKTADSLVL